MPSTLDLSCYHVARRFLQDGRRDWTLVLVGELLHSRSGRPLALHLLAEMYRDKPGTQESEEGSSLPAPGYVAVLATLEQGV